MVSTATPVAAYSNSNSGTIGGVSLQRTLGTPDWTPSLNRLTSGQQVVTRSPASTGTQLISINYRIWSLRNGQWTLAASPTKTFTVYPGQQVVNRGAHFDTLPGLFSVDYTITWKTSSGAVLGQTFKDFIYAADYQCNPGCLRHIDFYAGQYLISVS